MEWEWVEERVEFQVNINCFFGVVMEVVMGDLMQCGQVLVDVFGNVVDVINVVIECMDDMLIEV